MSEIVTAETWLFSVLASDSQLSSLVSGCYTFPAPRDTQLPYLVWQVNSPEDIRGIGPSRIGMQAEWLVRVIAETASFGGDLQTAVDRVDALLQAASGTGVWACVRTRPYQLVEDVSGRQIRHFGGFYRMWVSS